jgi:hypothetical protein
MFPGKVILEGDGRDTTSTAVSLARWFASHQGRGAVIVGDFSTATVFEAYADVRVPNGYDVHFWEVFYPGEVSSPAKWHLLSASGVQYLVIDSRIANAVPQTGYLFASEEVASAEPITQQSLAALESLPFLSLIKHEGTYSIYKVLGERG